MFRIKERLIAFYTKRLIKTRQTIHANVGFEQAQSIGILYRGDSSQKQAAVQELATRLKQLGKQVTTLCYVSDPKEVTSLAGPTLTLEEVTWLGNITSLRGRQFVETRFDYLYNVDWEGQAVVNYLLAISKAKCRIGHYSSSRAGLFEVMVSLAKEPKTQKMTDLTGQMLHYTQLLKTK